MMKNKYFLWFLGIVGIGLILFLVTSRGYYPIASVNDRVITGRQFKKNYRASTVYYLNVLKAYNSEFDPNTLDLKPIDFQVSVLDKLIENALIDERVRAELGDGFNQLLANRLEKFGNDTEFQRAAATLYGLDFGDVKREILVPQAERDLLADRLFLKGEDIEKWLADARRSSEVKIYSGQFSWNGEGVEIRK